ncbi:MAG: methyltransferase domain-containing protein [Methanolinea sp.]|nr:methyltransferase domain-containing protein [Methanolinea sp.]
MGLPGGPTKDEVMAISLSKLDLRPSDLFMDIGCGTGKVAVHAAPRVRKVIAIDVRGEAIAHAREAAARAGVSNIEFHAGNAADLIPSLPPPNAAFLGGSREIERILPLLAGLKVRAIVVNAVKIETVARAISLMEELGIYREAVLVQVAHAAPLDGGHIWRPANPVAVISGGVSPC